MRPLFGLPKLTIGVLRHAGLTAAELRDATDHYDRASGPAATVSPVLACWPMGFSWSSFVAQSFTVGVCEASDLTEHSIVGGSG